MAYIPEKETELLWWRDGVIYQIYPRSFMDTNGDGIGDLKGIISRLDYLAQLGVSAIWLSPISPSPDFDFGYDVSDYKDVDPKYGTLEDYKELIRKAHEHNIRVILDLVLNHTSTSHPWFVESAKPDPNEYSDYYLWQPGKNGKRPPNNWISLFTQKNGWEYVPERDQYYFHMFAKQQADLNWRNPNVYREMMDVFRFWLDLGTDGFRLDVFNLYFKDASFRSNPERFNLIPFNRQEHIYDTDQAEMAGVVRDIRSILNEYPQRYVVGEQFLSKEGNLNRYSGDGKLHAMFDFDFTHSPWNASSYRKIIAGVEAKAGNSSWPTYVLNNHDTTRSATRFGLGEFDERLKQAAALTLFLRGTPFLYYGEEIGMRETELKRNELMDPVGKNFYPFHKGRDGCRSPMQWNSQTNAGFSSGKPWNKLHPNFPERNVNAMIHDPNSLWIFYRDAIQQRKNHKALQTGDLTLLDQKNETVLSFLRRYKNQIALVAINFSQIPATFSLADITSPFKWNGTFSNKPLQDPSPEAKTIRLEGEQIALFHGKIGNLA
jgi:alpha-glucosidase